MNNLEKEEQAGFLKIRDAAAQIETDRLCDWAFDEVSERNLPEAEFSEAFLAAQARLGRAYARFCVEYFREK